MLKLFIGSTAEKLNYAEALQENLIHSFDVTVWTQGVFSPGISNLENLVNSIYNFDCAIFFFTCDDKVTTRGKSKGSIRDNLLFEYGLFMGALGRERVWFAYDLNDDLDNLPTDIAGICPIQYRSNSSNTLSAVGPIAAAIKRSAISFSEKPKEFEKINNNKDFKKFEEAKSKFLHEVDKFVSVSNDNVLCDNSLVDDVYVAVSIDVDKFEAINRIFGETVADNVKDRLFDLFKERLDYMSENNLMPSKTIEYYLAPFFSDEFFVIFKLNFSSAYKEEYVRGYNNLCNGLDANFALAQNSESSWENHSKIKKIKELKSFAEKLSQISIEDNAVPYNNVSDGIEFNKYLIEAAPIAIEQIETLIDNAQKASSIMRTLSSLVDETETLMEYLLSELNETYDNCMKSTNTQIMDTAIDLIGIVVGFNWESIAKGLFVTCSSGIAFRNDNETTERWLARAIYGAKLAKRTGGNQVAQAPMEVAQNEVWDLYNMGSDDWSFKLKKTHRASAKTPSDKGTRRFARRYPRAYFEPCKWQ